MRLHLATVLSIVLVLAAGTVGANELVARNLLQSQGCKGCHILEGDGGTLGPALDRTGARMKPNQIRQKLLDPKASNPKSAMPGFRHLKADEIKALVDFLASRK